MTKQILVPFDGSPQSKKALEYTLQEWADADITALNVIDLSDLNYHYQIDVVGLGKEWYENAQAYAEDILDDATELADEFDKNITTETEFGHPQNIIVEYAMEHDIDQIVIGSHGRTGPARVLLGSVAETVVRRAPVPVLVVR